MFRLSFVALLTLALAVSANPITVNQPLVSLPFAKRVNATGTVNIVERDLARIRALRARTTPHVFSEDAVSAPVTNELVSYIATVRIQFYSDMLVKYTDFLQRSV